MSTTRAELSADSLKERGAHRFDPVRFHYIESLESRASEQPESIRAILEGKGRTALQAYEADFERAREEAGAVIEAIESDFPEAGEDARQLFTRCEFRQLQRLQARLSRKTRPQPLPALTAAIAGRNQSAEMRDANENPAELESTRRFRDSLARSKANRLVKHAALDAPSDPGPLNPQMLAVRSLEVMRELSPPYLNRFVSYIDTLLWLQQAAEKKP